MVSKRKEGTLGYGFSMNFKKMLAGTLSALLLGAAMTVTVSALEPHGTGIKMRNWLVNDPDYEFSNAYKTSVWYQNFTSLELSGNDRNNVLRIAVSQLGYHEGNSPSDFHGMNTSGTENYIEYARLLTPNWNNNSYDWCACFVNWCLNQARFDKASSEISCGNWVSELQTMGMWQFSAAYRGTYIPKPADFIFFDWDATGTWPDHIGYVLYVLNGRVYTIEGNADDNVTVRSYPLSDTRILGYGTPPYDEGDEPTLDYAYADGMPRGIYVVNSAEAGLTDRIGANAICTVPLGASVRLIKTEGDFALVSYGDHAGYLPKSCLFLLTDEFQLIYDANGGTNPPTTGSFLRGHSAVISETIPTLEGDTFLGWSKVPYNVKVDFKPGDPITADRDTTLYAVWEKRSHDLAKQAADKGLLPEYERPLIIQNTAALLLGRLNIPAVFTDRGNTDIRRVEDEELGKVLSFESTSSDISPYVTLPYDLLCRSLYLKPVNGEAVTHVILRVKNLSMDNVFMKLHVNGTEGSAEATLTSDKGWQYVVFDLSKARLSSKLNELKLHWQDSSRVGDSLLLSEVYLVSEDAVRNAVLEGKYVFAPQALLTLGDKPPVDLIDPPYVLSPDEFPGGEWDTSDSVDSIDSDESETDSDFPDPSVSKGCLSTLRGSAWIAVVLVVCAPSLLRRKKTDTNSH